MWSIARSDLENLDARWGCFRQFLGGNSDYDLELRQPRSLSIKCQCTDTPCPGIQCPDQCILKLSGAALEGKSSLEDLLFVLNLKRVCSQQVFDMASDFRRSLLQEAAQHPNDFKNSNQANEPRILFAQMPIDNLISLACLLWIVLQQIAQDDVGIETDHRWKRSVAPASIAAFISSIEIGRLSLRTLPLSLEVRTFGRMATVPSG